MNELKETLIQDMNDDLANEYKHMHFYLHSAIMVQGPHREEIREYLLEHAASEMDHVKQFGDVILGLGGEPVTTVREFPSLTSVQDILEYALEMEEEVLENYIHRMELAERVGGVDGVRTVLFYEDQILDSRADADHLKQMVAK